jgi:hypothetical protein
MPVPEPVPSAAAPLQHAVAARSLVEQATGVLMWRMSLTSDAAAALLQRWSDDEGVDLLTLCDSVVNVICQPDNPRARDLALLRRLEDSFRQHEDDN